MTRRLTTLIVVIFMGLRLSAFAGDSKDTSSRNSDTAELTRLATEAGHAYARRDLLSLDLMTAEDYVQTDVRDGVLTRPQWLDFVKNRKSDLVVETDNVQIAFYENVAVVRGHWTYSFEKDGSHVVTHSQWTSVWSKYPEGWKRHTFQNTYVNPNADLCAIGSSK